MPRRSATAAAATAAMLQKGVELLQRGRLRDRGRQRSSTPSRRAARLRVPGADAGRGAARARLSALARVAGIADVRPPGRFRAISRSGSKAFDFDMIHFNYRSSLSPGNEQLIRWSSAIGGRPTARSISPAPASPAIDAMMQALLAATDARGLRRCGARARPRADLRLLRRPALPLRRRTGWRAGRACKHPETSSLSGPEPTTWWSEE